MFWEQCRFNNTDPDQVRDEHTAMEIRSAAMRLMNQNLQHLGSKRLTLRFKERFLPTS